MASRRLPPILGGGLCFRRQCKSPIGATPFSILAHLSGFPHIGCAHTMFLPIRPFPYSLSPKFATLWISSVLYLRRIPMPFDFPTFLSVSSLPTFPLYLIPISPFQFPSSDVSGFRHSLSAAEIDGSAPASTAFSPQTHSRRLARPMHSTTSTRTDARQFR